MKVITGCVIRKGNKILMVKEAKKLCYGQWDYPAGKLEEEEKITEGALRETLEETGCQVKLIHDLENNHIYPLEIFDTNHYNS